MESRSGIRVTQMSTLSRAAVLAGASLALTPAAAHAVNPYETIEHVRVALPDGVMPWAPTWAPDGEHILFHDYAGSQEWIADASGGHARCVTCGFSDRPAITGAFSYLFADGKRMFIANELGDVASVLECAPSVLDCASHRYLPVDLSADDSTTAGNPGLGRRTYHLSPDDAHLAYTNTRPDQLVMQVADLRRTDSGYVAANPRVVNPTPATDLLDRSAERWANGSQLFELKSFADGGAAVIIVGEREGGNADMFKLRLADGHLTRLTADPDWDEDGALAPDGHSLLAASWRGMDRLTPFGIFPTRPFLTYPLGAAVAIHYVSSKAGFACDLQPWLLPSDGDEGGTVAGQPLAPYRGGDDIVGNNLAGVAFWSPDSTRVLIQERQLGDVPASANTYVKQKGTAPNQLLIAQIKRPATAPVPVVKTVVGDWAPTPQAYRGAFGLPGITTVDGPRGGTATIVRGGNVAAIAGRVTYSHYSDDGGTFLDGTEEVTGSVARAGLRYVSHLRATDAAGAEVGHYDVELTFVNKVPAPPVTEAPTDLTGTVDVEYRGRATRTVASAAACPDSFVRPSPLVVRARRSGKLAVRATVTAAVLGDTRPVRGARVLLAGQRATTNAAGVATIRLSKRVKRGLRPVRAQAGSTFDAGRTTVRLPRRAAR